MTAARKLAATLAAEGELGFIIMVTAHREEVERCAVFPPALSSRTAGFAQLRRPRPRSASTSATRRLRSSAAREERAFGNGLANLTVAERLSAPQGALRPHRFGTSAQRRRATAEFLAFARAARAGKANPSFPKSALEARFAKGPFRQPSFGCVST